MNNPYWDWLKYQASTGVTVELKHSEPKRGRAKWWIRFNRSVETGPFKNKFDALLCAAHKLGMSGQRANWSPS